MYTKHRNSLCIIINTLFCFRTGKMTTESIRELVDEKIAGKKVVVFSKTTCPYCSKAKKILKEKEYNLTNEDLEIMEIDRHKATSKIQDYLERLTGARTVPRVFIKGKFIGGGDETAALHKKNKLKNMLE